MLKGNGYDQPQVFCRGRGGDTGRTFVLPDLAGGAGDEPGYCLCLLVSGAAGQ